MRRPRGAIDGVARIATAEGRHAGMGILVENGQVLTCAHVVNVALAREIDDVTQPDTDACVLVGFPFGPARPYRGRVVGWSAPGLGNTDAALIALEEKAPEEAGLATLAKIPDPLLLTGEMTVFGMTEGQVLGGHVEVALLGPVSGGWWQLVGTREIGTYAVQGFSGAAVWSRAQRAVIGTLVAVANEPEGGGDGAREQALPTPAERRTAYAQPVDVLKAALPNLPVEARGSLASSQRMLAASAVILFLMALVHLLGLHSFGMRQYLPYAQGSSLLVAFFSVQIVGILSLLGFWLIWRHVRAFSPSRSWETRFPSLLGRYPSDSLLNTRTGALIGLFLVVLLPIWVEGDALSEFVQGRHVVLFAREGEAAFHAEPGVGLMRTSPDPGLYRIAGIGDEQNAVSFFPIVQPVLVVGIVLASLLLALAILADLFVRPRLRRP